jgi:hypothetical protein
MNINDVHPSQIDATRNAAMWIARDAGLGADVQRAFSLLATVCLARGYGTAQALDACKAFVPQLQGMTAIRPGETWSAYYLRLRETYQGIRERADDDRLAVLDEVPSFLRRQAE